MTNTSNKFYLLGKNVSVSSLTMEYKIGDPDWKLPNAVRSGLGIKLKPGEVYRVYAKTINASWRFNHVFENLQRDPIFAEILRNPNPEARYSELSVDEVTLFPCMYVYTKDMYNPLKKKKLPSPNFLTLLNNELFRVRFSDCDDPLNLIQDCWSERAIREMTRWGDLSSCEVCLQQVIIRYLIYREPSRLETPQNHNDSFLREARFLAEHSLNRRTSLMSSYIHSIDQLFGRSIS